MSIRKQIDEVIEGLSPGECIEALGIMISDIERETEKMSKLARQVFNIPISKIDISPSHPFYVENDDDMKDLVQSIIKYGMITPGTVRTKRNGRYELLSGHRRLQACKLAGLDEFRCEVLTMSDEKAALFMIEANRQRMKLHPGEKSRLYRIKAKYTEFRDLKELRMDSSDTPWKIRSYLQLTSLIPEIRELVEKGSMSLRPAAELSQIPKKYQRIVFDEIDYNQSLPTHEQAIRIRKLSSQGKLTPDIIAEIIAEEKTNQKMRIILKSERALSAIPAEIPISKQEEYIAKALEFYGKSRRK